MAIEWGSWTSGTSNDARVGIDSTVSGTTITNSYYVEFEYVANDTMTLRRLGDMIGDESFRYSQSGGVMHIATNTMSGARGTTYAFAARVTGIYNGAVPQVESVNTTVPVLPPSAPGNLTITNITQTEATASWSVPYDGGSPIAGYQLQLDTSSRFRSPSSTNPSGTSFRMTGMTPGIRWYVRVRARNQAGLWGEWVAGGFYTAPTVPTAPRNLSITSVTDSTASATFNSPSWDGGDPVIDYQVSLNGSYSTTTSGNLSFSGLDPNVSNYVNVRARNSVDYGPWHGRVYFTTDARAPSMPLSVSADQVSSDSFRLTWAPPADDGGLSLSGYRVQVATDAAFGDIIYSQYEAGSTTSRTIGGLSNDTTYYARVRAVTDAFVGTWSATIPVSTLTGTPSAPRQVQVEEIGAASVTLSWLPPANDGGQPVTSYLIEASRSVSFSEIASSVEVPDSPGRITGLVPDTGYYLRVRAINSVGPGAATSSVGINTLAGVWIGTGTSWRPAVMRVGNGSSWQQVVLHLGDGGGWNP